MMIDPFATLSRILVFLLLFGIRVYAEPDSLSAGEYPTLFKPGTYRIVTKPADGEKVEVTLTVVSHRTRFPKEPHFHVRWGTDGGVPETLIGDIKVKINGREPAFGRPDFDYLGNPLSISVKWEKGDIVLLLSGGSAGGSYDAKWIFSCDRSPSHYILRKRSITAGESPEVHEITDYTY